VRVPESLCLGFIAGVLLGGATLVPAPALVLGSGAAGLLVALWGAGAGRVRGGALLPLTACCALLAGAAAQEFLEDRPPEGTLRAAAAGGLTGRWHGRPLRVEGVALADPIPGREWRTLDLRVDRLTVAGRGLPLAGTVRLLIPPADRSEELLPGRSWAGRRVSAGGLVRSACSPGNPCEENCVRRLLREGVGLEARVKSASLVGVAPGRPEQPVTALTGETRRAIRRGMRSAWRAADPEGRERLLEAFLLGGTGEVSPRILQAFRTSGLAHVVAISGLQIVLAAGCAIRLLRFIGCGPRSARMGGTVTALSYAALAGAEPSIVRAATGAAIWLSLRVAGRCARPLSVLALTAVLQIGSDPGSVGDPGLQLSFLATAALLLSPRAGPAAPGALRRGIEGLLRGSVAVQVATAPVLAARFGAIPLYAIVANLVAVPLGAGIVALGGLYALLSAAALPGATLLPPVIDPMLRGLLAVCRAAPDGPPLLVLTPVPAPALTLLCLSALGVAALSPGARLRAAGAAVAAVLVCCIVRGAPWPPAMRDSVRLDVIDVGQGDALLLTTPTGGRLLIDAGPPRAGSEAAAASRVVPALLRLGVERLDAMLITHPHADHLGGAAHAIRRLRPSSLWTAPSEAGVSAALVHELRGHEAPTLREIAAGTRLDLGGGLEGLVLMPDRLALGSKDPNARSVVLLVRYGGSSWLLAADLDGEGEDRLALSAELGRCDLLKVAHHGSARSAQVLLLERTAPQIAVISAGRSNPWGHPRREPIKRLVGAGALVFRTDLQGALGFESDGRLIRGGARADGYPRIVRAVSGSRLVDRHRGEAEKKDQPGDEGEPAAPRAQRHALVDDGRMPRPHPADDDRPDDPEGSAVSNDPVRGHGGETGQRAPRREGVKSPRQGIGDVTAVQLSCGHQVHRRREHAEPRGEEKRIEGQIGRSGRALPANDPREEMDERRIAEAQIRSPVGDHGLRHRLRDVEPPHQDRQQHHESRHRARDADVEEGVAMRDRPPDADQRAECPGGRERHRKEVGKRCGDAVIPARERVAELVRAENGDGAETVRESGPEQPEGAALRRAEEQTAGEGRGNDREQKQPEIRQRAESLESEPESKQDPRAARGSRGIFRRRAGVLFVHRFAHARPANRTIRPRMWARGGSGRWCAACSPADAEARPA